MTFKQRRALHEAANAPGITTTVIVLAVIVGAAVLCYFDKLDGAALVGLFSTIIGGVLVRAGVASGSAATSSPPPVD